jgi:hypothetical protein
MLSVNMYSLWKDDTSNIIKALEKPQIILSITAIA